MVSGTSRFWVLTLQDNLQSVLEELNTSIRHGYKLERVKALLDQILDPEEVSPCRKSCRRHALLQHLKLSRTCSKDSAIILLM